MDMIVEIRMDRSIKCLLEVGDKLQVARTLFQYFDEAGLIYRNSSYGHEFTHSVTVGGFMHLSRQFALYH